MVIDGGNSYYKDDMRRGQFLSEKGILDMDAGVSGGIWGLEIGYCLMIGGKESAYEHCRRFSRASRRRMVICTAARRAWVILSRWFTTVSSTG